MPSLGEVVDLLHGWYPPHTADAWDAVGLVVGRPRRRPGGGCMFAVDPTPGGGAGGGRVGRRPAGGPPPAVPEAASTGSPRPRRRAAPCTRSPGPAARCSPPTPTPTRRAGGVSEAMAAALGLTGARPLLAGPGPMPMDKLVVFVPTAEADRGPDRPRRGRCRPDRRLRPGVVLERRRGPVPAARRRRARPSARSAALEVVDEVRVEVVLPRRLRGRVVGALLAAHPYEEPAYDVVELGDPGRSAPPAPAGSATSSRRRCGSSPDGSRPRCPTPRTGVRVAGDPDRVVRRVALCGGAGDFLLDAVRGTDADVYVTSDLRHHPAAEFARARRSGAGRRRALGGGVDLAAGGLGRDWPSALGDTVEIRVSTIDTDPWQFRT